MRTVCILLGLLGIVLGLKSPWFSQNSAWNAVLPDNAPISPNSTHYVTGLIGQVKKYGPWINVEAYSVPVYTVSGSQPPVKVKLNKPNIWPGCVEDLQKAWDAVPIPPGATPAAGTDEHMVVWQPSTDTMWEFWAMQMNNQTHQWESQWGGKMNNVSSNPGFYTPPCPDWGATGTSLALAGGLLLIDEIRAGVIEHALAMAPVETLKDTIVPPAERGDGWSTTPLAIPEGTRFRLPANLNIKALGLHPFAELMALAMQKYGGLVRDTAGAVIGSYCEPAPKGQPDPYTGPNGFFQGLYPSQILSNFPWESLQVVDPSWQPWKQN